MVPYEFKAEPITGRYMWGARGEREGGDRNRKRQTKGGNEGVTGYAEEVGFCSLLESREGESQRLNEPWK